MFRKITLQERVRKERGRNLELKNENIELGKELSEREIQEIIQGRQVSDMEINLLIMGGN